MFKYYPNGNAFAIQQDHDNVIMLGGSNDRLSFLLPYNETIIAVGQNQTIALAKADGNTSVSDWAQGLTLDIQSLFGDVRVYGFQNDPTGHITTGHVTLTQDGHGGTWMSGVNGGGINGAGRVDFVGDDHLTLAQITQV